MLRYNVFFERSSDTLSIALAGLGSALQLFVEAAKVLNILLLQSMARSLKPSQTLLSCIYVLEILFGLVHSDT